MQEYEGIEIAYIPQCAVCEHVDGKGCKAFNTAVRERKYYDSRDKEFAKCGKFKLNRTHDKAVLFMKKSRNYNWQRP